MSLPVSDALVDAREKWCPVPILELARALRALPPGGTITLLATDPAVRSDLDAFCASTGHTVVSFSTDGRILSAQVRKAVEGGEQG